MQSLAACPDCFYRTGDMEEPPCPEYASTAAEIYDANYSVERVVREFDFEVNDEIRGVLEEINTDPAYDLISWMNLASGSASEADTVRRAHSGAFGDPMQATVKQAFEIMADRRATKIVTDYFPDWRKEWLEL